MTKPSHLSVVKQGTETAVEAAKRLSGEARLARLAVFDDVADRLESAVDGLGELDDLTGLSEAVKDRARKLRAYLRGEVLAIQDLMAKSQ